MSYTDETNGTKTRFHKEQKNKMEGKLQQQGYKVTIDAAGRVASVMLVEEYNYMFSVRIVSIQLHAFLPKSHQWPQNCVVPDVGAVSPWKKSLTL